MADMTETVPVTCKEDEIERVLSEFADFCRTRSRKQLKPRTLASYIAFTRVLIERHGLPLHTISLKNLEEVITSRIASNHSEHENSGDLSPMTVNRFVFVLRRWADFRGLDPESREVKRILRFKSPIPKRRLQESQLLTLEDVEVLIRHLRTPTWKTMIALLWDLGCRVRELTELDYDDVRRDRNGFVVHIRHSKTMERELRVLTKTGLAHLTHYMLTHKGSGALFTSRSGNRIDPHNIRHTLRRIECHVGKSVYPNLFRKSASTYWKNHGIRGHKFSDPAIRQRLGHAKNSRTFEQWYLTFGDKAYQNEEMAVLGISAPQEMPEQPERCWRCGNPVENGDRECIICHALPNGAQLLNDAPVQELEKVKSELANVESMLMTLIELLGDASPQLRIDLVRRVKESSPNSDNGRLSTC